MQDLRDLECLIALARCRHFARAAEQCGLSQPAFSMRIRALETRLDTRIVKRGNRFEGLTPEGEQVLAHARAIVSRVRALEETVKAANGEIIGALKLAVIPTAAAYAASLAQRLFDVHPGITTRIETTDALAVQQGVDDGNFDAGIIYGEGAATDLLRLDPLYDERYCLFLPAAMAPHGAAQISWEAAGRLPLILLEPRMQNRRIIDRAFRDLGQAPRVVSETSGFLAAVIMAARGMGATVIPEGLAEGLGRFDSMRLLPLTDPDVEKSVCLVTSRRDRGLPVIHALRALLEAPER